MPGKSFLLCLLGVGLMAAGGDLRAQGQEWKFDAQRSTVEVDVHSTFDNFICRAVRTEAQLIVDPESHQIERALVRVSLVALRTGVSLRDQHLRQWADEPNFSEVKFRLTALEPSEAGKLQARGELIWHGVEKGVTFPLRVLSQDELLSIDGELEVDYRDFGLPIIRGFYLLNVDPRLHVRFHLQGWLVGK